MTPPTPTSSATTTPRPEHSPPPAPAEMKCTLCGLSACWTEKEGAAGERP